MHAGLLDFFVLEASECVERLDGLLAHAGAPDPEVFARDVRALRGSATMAKVSGIADVAAGLERVAKGLRDGSLLWSVALRAAIVAALDDLKLLIRGVRTWGSEEERRAADRADELQALAPAAHRRSAATQSVGGGSAGFLSSETADVAAGLLRLADDAGRSPSFDETLRRLRALRGVAALLDLPPLAEVVAAVDEAARALEQGSPAPNDSQRRLFRAAAAVLREGSEAVHAGGRPDPGSGAVEAFAAAAERAEAAADPTPVVPIRSLAPDDGGDHVLHASPNPPMTPSKRFRLDVVSPAEHLRRLVSDARRATDALTRNRLGRELRSAVRSLAASAETYAEFVVARALHACIEGASGLESRVLAALDEAAIILSAPGDAPLGPRFEALAGTAPTPIRSSTPVRAITPVRTTTPSVPPRPVTPSTNAAIPSVRLSLSASAAPSGPALHDMLGEGITGLSGLEDEPLSEPIDVEDDGIVPIQDLLYRGSAALRRAIELGDALKRSAAPSDAERLAELYDLLELAATE